MDTEIRKLKDRAADEMARRHFDKAAELYARLCEAEPSDFTLRQHLGDAQRQGGRVGEAVLTYESVAARFAREGSLLKAIAINKVILELDPKRTTTQATLARLYAEWQGEAPTPKPNPPRPGASSRVLAALAARSAYAALKPPPLPRSNGAARPTRVVAAVPAKPTSTRIFNDLKPEAFVSLLQRCLLLRFQAHDLIVRQGDPGRSFFMITSGTVTVHRADETREIVEVAQLKEGTFFGEMALFAGEPRTVSVTADGPVELLEFPGELLTHLTAQYPSARRAIESRKQVL